MGVTKDTATGGMGVTKDTATGGTGVAMTQPQEERNTNEQTCEQVLLCAGQVGGSWCSRRSGMRGSPERRTAILS